MNAARRTSRLRPIFAILLLSATAVAQAQPVVHNTGVDGADALVAAGGATSYWLLSDKPAASSLVLGSTPFRYYNGAYFADTATAAWVSPNSNGFAGATGNHVYTLQVDLTGLNPATVSVSGVFGTDNDGAIWVNNETPAATTGFAGFGGPTAFTLDQGWVDGINTISVRVNNGGDPTAFYVRFDSTEGEPPVIGPPPAPPQPQTPVPTLSLAALLALIGAVWLIGAVAMRRG